jgi:predicted DNA-binding ribbon-helix-helix protein
MLRKTMAVGRNRTSIKLEKEFWAFLEKLAAARGTRLSKLVREVAAAHPDRSNLASTLRVFALAQAQAPGPPHDAAVAFQAPLACPLLRLLPAEVPVELVGAIEHRRDQAG